MNKRKKINKDVMYRKTMPAVSVFNGEKKDKLRRVIDRLKNVENRKNN